MPFYGLKFDRVIDYENGPSLTTFLKIIKTDSATIADATAALTTALNDFIDLANSYTKGTAWENERKHLGELEAKLAQHLRDSKEDRAFLSGEHQATFDQLASDITADLKGQIEKQKALIESIRDGVHKTLYTEVRPGYGPNHRWRDLEDDEAIAQGITHTAKLDLAEWKHIPGFGDLNFEELLDRAFHYKRILSFPEFEIISADEALAILEKREAKSI